MTGQSLKIAVADDEPDMRDFFCKVLPHIGHQVVAVATNGRELVEQCTASPPDLIITDIVMPEQNGLEALREICREHPVPAILVTAHQDEEYVDQALKEQVLAYVVKPIKKDDLAPVISLAMRRFAEFQALHQQAADLKQALEDRKIIERAKGILMKRAGLDEPDAFRRLQKLSSDKNEKMVNIARMIVTADEAMQI